MEATTQTEVRDRRGASWRIILAVLLTLELITGVVLSTRLVNFSVFRHNFIALMGGATSQRVMAAYDDPVPGLYVARDPNHPWTLDTDFELFKMRYDNNGDLIYTVASSRDDKVLAPGTGNQMQFTVGNPLTERVDYSLTLKAWQEGAEETLIPLTFRLYDDLGRYYVGGEAAWQEPEALNTVNQWESLQGGQTRTYTIEWQWPFERGTGDELVAADAYDTALGDRAVTEDIVQHVTVTTTAEVYQVGEAARAWWGGASWALVNLICMILTDALGVVEVIKAVKGRKQKKKGKPEPAYEDAAAAAAGPAAAAAKDARERKRMGWKLFQTVPFLFGTVVFHLTENMRLPMVYVDKWTILMVVTLLVSVTLALLTRQKDPKQEEKKAPEEAAGE